MLHSMIGSWIADAQLTSLAVDQFSSPTLNILRISRRWRDRMGSHRLHLDMEVLGWLASCQMERWKRSYFKKRFIWWDCSTSSHSLRSWTRMSKSNQWITTVPTSTMPKASWLPLHLRSMGDSVWIELWSWPNWPISMIAACWHLWHLGMHLGFMQRCRCYGTAAWHMSVSKSWRSCQWSRMLQDWLESGIATVASSASLFASSSLPQPPAPLSHCS